MPLKVLIYKVKSIIKLATLIVTEIVKLILVKVAAETIELI